MAKLFEFTKEYEGEEISKRGKKRGNKGFPKFLIPLIPFVVLVIAFLIGTAAIPVVDIRVEGNEHCSSENVIGKFFQSSDDYRLLTIMKKMVTGISNEAFETASVTLTGLQSCKITVKEVQPVAQINQDNQYIFLSENAIVVAVSSLQDEKMPLVSGITLTKYEGFDFAQAKDAEELNELLQVGKIITELSLQPGSIYVKERQYYVTFGDVTVSLGGIDSMKEKLKEVSYQIPTYQKLKGILHIESYDAEDHKPVFYFEIVNE